MGRERKREGERGREREREGGREREGEREREREGGRERGRDSLYVIRAVGTFLSRANDPRLRIAVTSEARPFTASCKCFSTTL
jgi:hypothetical protein